jgi:hypothetical protein
MVGESFNLREDLTLSQVFGIVVEVLAPGGFTG